jgi:hypothetical protein
MNRKEVYDKLKEMEVCEKFNHLPDLLLLGDDDTIVKALDSLDAYEFIAQHEFPKPSFLLSEFGNIGEAGYVIKNYADFTLDKNRIKTHFLNCKCTVNVPDYYIGYLYVSNGSDVIVNVGSFVYLNLVFYDGSHAKIEEINDSRNSKVKVKYKNKGYEV